MTEPSISQRIDKWIWHARVVKSRNLAQNLITAGKVRVDREKVTSASYKLRVGNVLTVTMERSIKILEVVSFLEKRGSFEIANQSYKDLSPTPDKNETTTTLVTAAIKKNARPTKQERREAIRLKQNSN